MKIQVTMLMVGFATLGLVAGAPVDWTVAKAEREMKEQSKELQVLDVRTEDEFKEGHIDAARRIAWTDDDFKERANRELDPEKPVFVYCRSGKRSDAAAKALEKLGFKQVFTLKGGILAWEKEGRPVVKPE